MVNLEFMVIYHKRVKYRVNRVHYYNIHISNGRNKQKASVNENRLDCSRERYIRTRATLASNPVALQISNQQKSV